MQKLLSVPFETLSFGQDKILQRVFVVLLQVEQQEESDLHSNILDVFNENRVQIMTPSYMADPEAPKIAPIEDAKAVEAT